jgi:hypothetical protein
MSEDYCDAARASGHGEGTDETGGGFIDQELEGRLE